MAEFLDHVLLRSLLFSAHEMGKDNLMEKDATAYLYIR